MVKVVKSPVWLLRVVVCPLSVVKVCTTLFFFPKNNNKQQQNLSLKFIIQITNQVVPFGLLG